MPHRNVSEAEIDLLLNDLNRANMRTSLSLLNVAQSLDLKYLILECNRPGLFRRQNLLTH